MKRGEIWWAQLGEPGASEPGYRRPVLVVQSDPFNRSNISTVVVASLTSNTRLAAAPGNVLLKRGQSKLPKESVVNVSQLYTLDKSFLTDRVSILPATVLGAVDEGIRLVLDL